MARLKNEGYNEIFRINVLKQAIARFDGMVEAHQRGTQPLSRDKNWSRVERNRQKQNKKSKWAKDCESVIFVQYTPNGELARQFREVVESYPGKVKFKIVEQGGKVLNPCCKNPTQVEELAETVQIVLSAKLGGGLGGTVENRMWGMRLCAMNVETMASK